MSRKPVSRLLPGLLTIGLALSSWAQPIIVDHRHRDLAKVPAQWIKLAKSSLRVAYQHTSHGSQLVTGIQALASFLGSPYSFTSTSSGYNAGAFLNDYGIAGASDLGNPSFTAWYDATRSLLNRAGGCDRNVVMWSWCGPVPGDLDGDGLDEAAVDFGADGMWALDVGSWTALSSYNPDGLLAADVDGDGAAEVAADFGYKGLWLWNAGAWMQLSALNPDYLAVAGAGGAGGQDILAGFGALGLWRRSGGTWTQLSGARVEGLASADFAGGGAGVAADFGALGLWLWDGSAWDQLAAANPESLAVAVLDGEGRPGLAADFGALGLWFRDADAWTQLSANDPE